MKTLKYAVLLGWLLVGLSAHDANAKPVRNTNYHAKSEALSDFLQFGFRLGAGNSTICEKTHNKKWGLMRHKGLLYMFGKVIGPALGIYGEYCFYQPWNLAAALELNYARGGYCEPSYENRVLYENRVGVAGLIKFYPKQFGEVFCTYAGLQFDTSMGKKKLYHIKTDPTSEKKEIGEEYKKEEVEAFEKTWQKHQLGIVAGVELIFNFNSFRLKLGGRYFNGMLNRYKKDSSSSEQTGTPKDDDRQTIMTDFRNESYIAFDFAKLIAR